MPDFSNRVNAAEQYARQVSGISRIEENSEKLKTTSVLPSFNRALLATADRFEVALKTPASKRLQAFKEVLLVEQMQHMLRSNAAILEFEDLRFRLVGMTDKTEQRGLLNRIEAILLEELDRTKAALETSLRDSRLGYEMEMDYVYAPHVLRASSRSCNKLSPRRFLLIGRRKVSETGEQSMMPAD